MPQYSVVGGNDDNNIRAVHALLDLRIFPRPQRIRATAAILLFIDYEYNYSVPGGNRQSKTANVLFRHNSLNFLPTNLSGYAVSMLELTNNVISVQSKLFVSN